MSEQKQDVQEQLEVLQPSAEPREWTLGLGENQKTYVQKPLPVLKKMRFFALLGQTVRQATAVGGEGALSDILSGQSLIERGRQIASSDMRDAESMVNLASSLVVFVPDFLEDSICEWWSIPYDERRTAKALMELSKEEGGLSDEDLVLIVQTFIEQNWQAIRDFFGVHLPTLWRAFQARTETTEETASEEADTE